LIAAFASFHQGQPAPQDWIDSFWGFIVGAVTQILKYN
jgi:hypothetical protein